MSDAAPAGEWVNDPRFRSEQVSQLGSSAWRKSRRGSFEPRRFLQQGTMMSKQLSRTLFLAFSGFAASCGLIGGSDAWAGPARYDPETRSIRLTYTYAALAEG